MTHIEKFLTVGTGGNCMADLLYLKSGALVVITDECLAVYDNPADFEGDGEVENCRMLDESFQRCESGESSDGLTFVRAIECFEPDGPVTVDLVILADWRVIGIDGETAVIYPYMTAFDAISDERGTSPDALPALDLAA